MREQDFVQRSCERLGVTNTMAAVVDYMAQV